MAAAMAALSSLPSVVSSWLTSMSLALTRRLS
jgi:hypothetical protein